MRHAQVEQRERVLGPLGQLQLEQPQVALALPLLRLAGCGSEPGVDDVHVGPGHLAAGAADRRQDLLVDPPVEPQVGPVAEELDVIDDRHVELAVAVLAAARTVHLHRRSPAPSGRPGASTRSRSLRPHSGGIVSSESIQNSHSPRACRSDSLRAAEKSSHQGKWNSRPPNDSTIRGVSSTEPVSTMTISSTQGRMLSRQAGRVRAESRTIMQSDSRGLAATEPQAAARRRSRPRMPSARLRGTGGREAASHAGRARPADRPLRPEPPLVLVA